jgi:hypothetical protein
MRGRGLVGVVAAGIAVAVVAPTAYGYVETAVRVRVRVSTAVLGEPGIAVSLDGTAVVVRPVQPADGPAPARYSVQRLDVDGVPSVVCADLDPGATCRDAAPDGDGGPTAARYVVTAWLGDHWQRSCAPAAGPRPAQDVSAPVSEDSDLAVPESEPDADVPLTPTPLSSLTLLSSPAPAPDLPLRPASGAMPGVERGEEP